jgi:hypothetical protein
VSQIRATRGTELSTIAALAGWFDIDDDGVYLSIDHVVDHRRRSYACGLAVRADSCVLNNS